MKRISRKIDRFIKYKTENKAGNGARYDLDPDCYKKLTFTQLEELKKNLIEGNHNYTDIPSYNIVALQLFMDSTQRPHLEIPKELVEKINSPYKLKCLYIKNIANTIDKASWNKFWGLGSKYLNHQLNNQEKEEVGITTLVLSIIGVFGIGFRLNMACQQNASLVNLLCLNDSYFLCATMFFVPMLISTFSYSMFFVFLHNYTFLSQHGKEIIGAPTYGVNFIKNKCNSFVEMVKKNCNLEELSFYLN